MTEATLENIGLKTSDLGDEKLPEDMVSHILASARLFRKSMQHLVRRDLRIYFQNPRLDYSDDIRGFFPYRDRRRRWGAFRASMEFNIPKLETERLAIFLILAYLMVYVYNAFQFWLSSPELVMQLSLSGLSVGGLIFLGALLPTLAIYAVGQTRLPAGDVDGLVDRIIQESMLDWLSDDKKALKDILNRELGALDEQSNEKQ